MTSKSTNQEKRSLVYGFRALVWLSKQMMMKELRIYWMLLPIFGAAAVCYIVFKPMMMQSLFAALQQGDGAALVRTCLIIAGLIAVAAGIQYVSNTYADMHLWRLMYTSKRAGFLQYQQLPWRESTLALEEGDTFARLNDGGDFGAAWSFIFTSVVDVGSTLFLLGWGAAISWQVVLWVAAAGVVSLITNLVQVTRSKRLQERKLAANGECEWQLQGLVQGTVFAVMNGVAGLLHERYAQKRKLLWRIQRQEMTLDMVLEAVDNSAAALLRGGMARIMLPLQLTLATIVAGFALLDGLRVLGSMLRWSGGRIIGYFVQATRLYDMLQLKRGGAPASADPNAAITVRNASLTLGDRPVLSDISLTIQPVEKVALVGRNGCDKSTLLRVLMGLYKPDNGSAALLGQDAAYVTHEQRRQLISFIPSRHQVFSEPVRDNVAMNAEDDELSRVAQALIWAEAVEFTAQDASTLSGGQMQRVNVARGLAHRAAVCLADEPEASLDRETGERVLRNIVEQSQTLVAVTHHPANLRLFDRVVVMEEGRIACDGTPDAVAGHPAYQAWERDLVVEV